MGKLEGHRQALVVGAGFGGLYSLYLLKQQGLDVIAIDTGSDVGGTWYWNTYPGARSDVNTHSYQLSFDKDLWHTYTGPNNYFMRAELQHMFQDIAKKHDLYPLIHFNTELKSAHYNESKKVWECKTSNGEEFTVRYLVTAIGILHRPYSPDLPGLDKFEGKIVHSAQWGDTDYKNKKIGVIGSGASGVQLVSSIAPEAGSLTHFIRHAQYVLPAQYKLRGTEEKKEIDEKYVEIWSQIFESGGGFGYDEPQRKTTDVSDAERDRIFQELWDLGSGFRFLFGGFSDIATDEKANQAAIDFIQGKIKEIVKDEKKAKVLLSKDWFARRPLTDDFYYERFNQDNVDAVDVAENPIKEITAKGIKLEDGTEHPLDLLVFCTGFDQVEGSYFAIDVKGKDGVALKDKWSDYPKSYLGTQTAGFPNLFFINGPGVPWANNPPVCEAGANFVSELIARGEDIRARGHGSGVVEAEPKAEEDWTEKCRECAEGTIFAKTQSWVWGTNVPGRKRFPRFWFGGIKPWREAINEAKNDGYAGFDLGLPGEPNGEHVKGGPRTPHTGLGQKWAS